VIVMPAIDLRGGRCVRLYQGEFDAETGYDHDPLELALEYQSAGCRELHVVDLDGARTGDPANLDIIRAIARETALTVQVGGGIRDQERLQRLFHCGVDRVVIGSQAVNRPETVTGWLREAGPQHIVIALDVRLDERGIPRVTSHGWTRDSELTLWQAVERFAEPPLSHVLCTDISRDGALTGPNVELYGEFVARFPEIGLQASGGVRDVTDLEALRACGAAAAITGKALLEGTLTRQEAGSFSRDA
jgi:phosphoribosylformimino-5-aminoimidazole carboxamide ribotide isomerase